jgi:hypothetical protein
VAACSLLALAELDNDNDWAVAGGLIAGLPLFRVWEYGDVAVIGTFSALLLNIMTALRHKHELNRWLSTILWLVVPLSLGNDVFKFDWMHVHYAWSYVLVMVGLITSRSIARGVILVANNVPLASYARTASLSYVYGYSAAALFAVTTALSAANSQLHATLILIVLTFTVWVLSKYIEKRPDILVLIPILLQAILLSAIRPTMIAGSVIPYLFLSTATALLSYVVAISKDKNISLIAFQQGALISVFLTPLSYFIIGETLWPMPFGLLCAGIVVYYHISNTTQQNRELAGGLILGSILWFMNWGGVQNIQAYSHVIAALFALYAYWRSTRREIEQSDQYLIAMLGMATIPLALESIGGLAGDFYGWWLLLEQVGFMLLGMVINKKFVVRWGLYVAVASVLYQLRNLGWAALTVLAMFIIGVAIYQLQKHDDKK